LIFDEVICAFGRTGKQFAADSFDVVPDMVTMAKALTNGVVPMGAVACREEIYETITSAAPEAAVELFHGYTYSGCPAATAAALATRDIFEQEDLVGRAGRMAPAFLDAAFSLRDLPVVTDIRGYGLLAAIDLAPLDAPGQRGSAVLQALYDAGLIVKVTGDVQQAAPGPASAIERLTAPEGATGRPASRSPPGCAAQCSRAVVRSCGSREDRMQSAG
jgi:beta-alanine--pyruvate transaminase